MHRNIKWLPLLSPFNTEMPNGLNRSKDCREMGPVAGRAISLYPKLEAFPSHQTASLPVPGRRQERVTGPGAA
ncbi:MAG: hypothetical protein ACYTAQ_14715, partial [Planctomycetota bacterium]